MVDYKMGFVIIFVYLFFLSSFYKFDFLIFLFFSVFFIYSLFPLYWATVTEFFFFDQLSISLSILSGLVITFMFMSTPMVYKSNSNKIYYYVLMFFLPLLIFTFSFNNILFFYILFEASLIPTFFLIVGWGYQVERVQAIYYFMLYTICASLPLLTFIVFLPNLFSFFFLMEFSFSLIFVSLESFILAIVIMLAFLSKLPMYLVHLWLPKAHVEAPVTGSMILAAILLKLGGYGLIRTMFFWFSLKHWVLLFLWISSLSMFVVGVLCMKLTDMKALVAYSSISHMGMGLASLLSIYKIGGTGCLMMLLSHGICSSGMFYLIGVIYNSSGTRSSMINKGFLNLVKGLSFFMFMLYTPNMGVPLTMNLFSEIYIVMSLISLTLYNLAVVVMGMFFVAYFTILLLSFTIHGVNYSILYFKMKLGMDVLLVFFLHVYALNISFFVISLF